MHKTQQTVIADGLVKYEFSCAGHSGAVVGKTLQEAVEKGYAVMRKWVGNDHDCRGGECSVCFALSNK